MLTGGFRYDLVRISVRRYNLSIDYDLLQVYLVKKPVNFGPHFLVNESETR